MAMSLHEFCEYHDKTTEAQAIYKKLPSLHEGQNQLQNLSDEIGHMVGELISRFTCPACWKSHGTPKWSTCYCWETNDAMYEWIDSVGRIRASMRWCHIGPDD